MTPFDRLTELMSGVGVDVWLLGKMGVLLFLFLYFLFSLVVVKQIRIMSKTIKGVMEKEMMMVAKILVGLAGAVFLLGLVIL